MVKKYKCIGCGKYKNDNPYELCKDCEDYAEREESSFEKEYGTPKEID